MANSGRNISRILHGRPYPFCHMPWRTLHQMNSRQAGDVRNGWLSKVAAVSHWPMSILLGPFLAVSAPATKAGLLRRCSCSAFVGGLMDTWVSATMKHSKQQKENYYHKGAATKVDSIVPRLYAFAMDGPVLVGDGTQKVHASVVYNRSRSNQIKSGHQIRP